MLAFIMQGINMMMFATYNTEFTLMVGAAVAGVGYGTLLAVFPSITADYYGLKNYGGNYGVLYTAWGVSGFIGPVVAATAVDMTGNYVMAYTICAAMLAVAVVLSIITKPVKAEAADAQKRLRNRTLISDSKPAFAGFLLSETTSIMVQATVKK